jgi:hypothetical protein
MKEARVVDFTGWTRIEIDHTAAVTSRPWTGFPDNNTVVREDDGTGLDRDAVRLAEADFELHQASVEVRRESDKRRRQLDKARKKSHEARRNPDPKKPHRGREICEVWNATRERHPDRSKRKLAELVAEETEYPFGTIWDWAGRLDLK